MLLEQIKSLKVNETRQRVKLVFFSLTLTPHMLTEHQTADNKGHSFYATMPLRGQGMPLQSILACPRLQVFYKSIGGAFWRQNESPAKDGHLKLHKRMSTVLLAELVLLIRSLQHNL